MRIAVIGATGVLGTHLIPRLIERGHSVNASALPSERLSRFAIFKNVNVTPGNILERDSLKSVVENCDVVMHIATAVPRPGAKKIWTLNDRIRREGTANAISVCEHAGVKLYIQQSIAHLTNNSVTVDKWLNENSQINPNEVTQSAAEMEALVKKSNLNWQILRGGSLYGSGTGREEFWSQAAQLGNLEIPNDGKDYISLIHVSDLAAAFVAAAESQKNHLLLNVVDDEPVTYTELFSYIAKMTGAKAPQKGGTESLPSFRVENNSIKNLLVWKPHYSTYRSGLATMTSSQKQNNQV